MEIPDDKLQEIKEQAYIEGQRSILVQQLSQLLQRMGYSSETKVQELILEREQALATLRSLCEKYGDNDWENDLHLSDIIEKHLGDHL